ncbi:alpha/beta hydrolase [Patescibacteria group bacterium]|nr:alpha/beta hydrolase [Patescibacteria group bacterium]
MKTLVILHGWKSSPEKWVAVKGEIAKAGIKVIIPDLPGFKNPLSKPWNLDDYALWFHSFVASQNISQFYLLGHSFGGRMAIKIASKNPQNIQAVILVSSAGIKRVIGFWKKIVMRIAKGFRILNRFSLLRRFFYKFIVRQTDYVNTSGHLTETFKNIINEDLEPRLKEIKLPVCLVWGKADKITPLSDAHIMKEKIANSQLFEMDGIGHAPYLENPKALARLILDFIC